ncbi:MAG: hypothetical protein VX589_18220 [Myxococcota bacterium]|nr:hypothetical protein [Myxococcota bacterium]
MTKPSALVANIIIVSVHTVSLIMMALKWVRAMSIDLGQVIIRIVRDNLRVMRKEAEVAMFDEVAAHLILEFCLHDIEVSRLLGRIIPGHLSRADSLME